MEAKAWSTIQKNPLLGNSATKSGRSAVDRTFRRTKNIEREVTTEKKSRPSRIGTKKVEEKPFEFDFYDDDNVVTERMGLSEQIGSEWRQSKGTGDVSIRTTSETGRHDVNDKKNWREQTTVGEK